MPIPSRPSFSTRSAVTRSTLWATYSKPLSAPSAPRGCRPRARRGPRRACCAAFGGSSTWYGVAKIVAASSETARALPRRSRIAPRMPGTVDGGHLLAARVGAELAALDGLQPGGPDDDDAESDREGREEQADALLDQLATVAPRVVVPAARSRAVRRRIDRDRASSAGSTGTGRGSIAAGSTAAGSVTARPDRWSRSCRSRSASVGTTAGASVRDRAVAPAAWRRPRRRSGLASR